MAISAAEFEAAIRQLITVGQSVRLPDGRAYTLADLPELGKMHQRAQIEEASAGGGGGVYVPLQLGSVRS